MNKSVAISVHGMNSRKGGAGSIDKLVKCLDVDYVDLDDGDYGYTLLFKIWLFKRAPVERLAGGIIKWIDDDRIDQIFIPLHSNGLNFTLQALNLLEKRGQRGDKEIIIISYSGCANRRVNTDAASAVHNWYTKRDGWLFFAKWLPSWTMGSFGRGKYRGKSNNVYDKDIGKHISSHSQWFKDESLKTNIKKTNQLIQAYS